MMFSSKSPTYKSSDQFKIIKSLYISFDIESNGLISAAPFICQSILTFFGGWYTDYIRSKGILHLIIIISKVKTQGRNHRENLGASANGGQNLPTLVGIGLRYLKI